MELGTNVFVEGETETSFPLILQWRKRKGGGGGRGEEEAESREKFREWVKSHRKQLLNLASLHGVVLFRGFPFLLTAQDFDDFISDFELTNFSYDSSLSNAVRTLKTERVFTANEAPPSIKIFLHHELAQTPCLPPSHLFFFCEQPAEEGGATSLCQSHLLFERLAERLPSFLSSLEEKGLKYTHTMPPTNNSSSGMGRSWQSTLRVSNSTEAEDKLSSLGYTWEWLPNTTRETETEIAIPFLRVTTPVLPAVKTLSDGRKTFFNQLIAAFHGWRASNNNNEIGSISSPPVQFGDGTELELEVMNQVLEMAEEMTVNCEWQRGDVALVDNSVALHGRREFKGTRKVLASLISASS